MSDSQTTPTTAACVEWLGKMINSARIAIGGEDRPKHFHPDWEINLRIYETIRAQLIAAQEMADALERIKDYDGPIYNQAGGYCFDKAQDALTAWRNAGGK